MRRKGTKAALVSFVLIVANLMILPVYAVESENAVCEDEILADYIINNIEVIAKEFNEINNEEEVVFAATYCENQRIVKIINSDRYATYLDFDGDNGYMLVGDDEVLKFSTSGNLNYMTTYEGDIYYSVINDGFAYYDNGEYFLFEKEVLDEGLTDTSYAGTNDNGTIKDRDAYVKDRYGNLTLYDQGSLSNVYLKYTGQYRLSVYVTKDDVSEGNCVLTAIFNALNFLQKRGVYSALPKDTSTATVIPSNDYFYKSAMDNKYKVNAKQLPSLYYRIRQMAIASYGYTVANSHKPDGSKNPSGIGSSNVPTFISAIGNYYGTSISVKKKSASMDVFITQIKNQLPVIWGLNDSVYGGHTVLVTGYYIYKQYSTVLGVKVCTKTVNMVRLMDGWYEYAIYYDMKSSSGTAYVFS